MFIWKQLPPCLIAISLITSACSVSETGRKQDQQPQPVVQEDSVFRVEVGGFITKMRHTRAGGAPDYYTIDGRINPGSTEDTQEVILSTAESMTIEGIERFSCAPGFIEIPDLKKGEGREFSVNFDDIENPASNGCYSFLSTANPKEELRILFKNATRIKANGESVKHDIMLVL